MEKDEEIQIARRALGALTRLKQGYNPFVNGQLEKLTNDEAVYCQCCERLNIAISYDKVMFQFFQDIIRGREPDRYFNKDTPTK